MNTIDARGLSCPEPVIMIRKAMATGDAQYEMVVDNPVSKENVTPRVDLNPDNKTIR